MFPFDKGILYKFFGLRGWRLDLSVWQDKESLRLKVVLDAHTNAVSFDEIRVSRVTAGCYRVVQKARRILVDRARRS